ncbi:MAG: hypothetical protein R3F46_01920 [bacterium]
MRLLFRLLLALCLGLLRPGPAAAQQPGPDPERIVACYISMGCWDLALVEQQFSELSASGVDFVIDYALFWPEQPQERQAFDAYMASARRHGISIGYCLFSLLDGASPRANSRQIDTLLAQVEILRHESQIGAWYVHDEILPMLSGVDGTERYSLSLEQMRELYRRIHELDPGRPQLCVWNQLPDHAEMQRRFGRRYFPHGYPDWMNSADEFEAAMQSMLRDCCDWVLVDCYPYGAPWLPAQQSMQDLEAEVSRLVSRAADLRGEGQPLLFVYQSFDWRVYGRAENPAGFPGSARMRAMLAAAFAAGADNAVAYSWFDLVRPLEHVEQEEQLEALAELKLILRELQARR